MEIRELNGEMEYSVEERDMLAKNEISIDELREFLRSSGSQNLDAAIGGIMNNRAKADAAAAAAPVEVDVAEESAQSSDSEVAAS